MPDAPPPLPDKHAVLHTFAAHIDAAPADVFERVRMILDPAAGEGTGLFVDAGSLTVVAQGAWWYRAEYRVIADTRGATLEHVVLNVAQRGERAARLAGRRVIQGAPLAFHDLVKQLRTDLE